MDGKNDLGMGSDTAAALPAKAAPRRGISTARRERLLRAFCWTLSRSLNLTLGSNHRLVHETDLILTVTYGAVHVGAREGAVDG